MSPSLSLCAIQPMLVVGACFPLPLLSFRFLQISLRRLRVDSSPGHANGAAPVVSTAPTLWVLRWRLWWGGEKMNWWTDLSQPKQLHGRYMEVRSDQIVWWTGLHFFSLRFAKALLIEFELPHLPSSFDVQLHEPGGIQDAQSHSERMQLVFHRKFVTKHQKCLTGRNQTGSNRWLNRFDLPSEASSIVPASSCKWDTWAWPCSTAKKCSF